MYQAYTRQFWLRILLVLCGLSPLMGFAAIPDKLVTGEHTFVEGEHYNRFPATVVARPEIKSFMAQDTHKIQVIEFFSYACYGCYRLQEKLENWQKTIAPEIHFYRLPVVFFPNWATLAKAYYTAAALNLESKLNHSLFAAIHEKKRDISQEAELKNFFEESQVPEAIFWGVYRSFEVERQFKKGNELSLAYQIAESPALIINGPTGSYLTSAFMAKSEDRLFILLAALLERELAALKNALGSES